MSRIRTILTVGALTAGLIGGAVPAALAGTTPTPADTPAFGGGGPTPAPASLRPEQFTVAQVFVNGNEIANDVEATGPVRFTAGRDDQITPIRDVFRQPFTARSVNVLHNPLGVPVVNLRTCSVTIDQNGLWAFAGGTGRYRNAAGRGVFHLDLVAAWPSVRGLCPIASLTPVQIQRDLDTSTGPAPSFVSVAVVGAGAATR